MSELSKNLVEKRKARAKQTAEIFTPYFLVNEILDKLSHFSPEAWEKEKTFLDPACGNGNFLIFVLWRKIALGHSPLEALKTIYGVDIMSDNIRECRLKLLKIVSLVESITLEHIKIVFKNIVKINIKKYPLGSLQYDYSFSNSPKKEDIELWLEKINKGELDTVDLPVTEDNFNGIGFDIFDMFSDNENIEENL